MVKNFFGSICNSECRTVINRDVDMRYSIWYLDNSVGYPPNLKKHMYIYIIFISVISKHYDRWRSPKTRFASLHYLLRKHVLPLYIKP
jgi:hypothetical protein